MQYVPKENIRRECTTYNLFRLALSLRRCIHFMSFFFYVFIAFGQTSRINLDCHSVAIQQNFIVDLVCYVYGSIRVTNIDLFLIESLTMAMDISDM